MWIFPTAPPLPPPQPHNTIAEETFIFFVSETNTRYVKKYANTIFYLNYQKCELRYFESSVSKTENGLVLKMTKE
jgi:hypothetical protein